MHDNSTAKYYQYRQIFQAHSTKNVKNINLKINLTKRTFQNYETTLSTCRLINKIREKFYINTNVEINLPNSRILCAGKFSCFPHLNHPILLAL